VFVSHDRYFVERLATKIIEIADGDALVYPGTYKEFLWHKEHPGGREAQVGREGQVGRVLSDPPASRVQRTRPAPQPQKTSTSHEEKKRVDAATRKRERAAQARQAEIDALEKQVADCEAALREIEQTMASPGFYENREAAQPIIDRHQALMWQVGDLMHRWEKLQSETDLTGPDRIVI